jgi:hypothetical protein
MGACARREPGGKLIVGSAATTGAAATIMKLAGLVSCQLKESTALSL